MAGSKRKPSRVENDGAPRRRAPRKSFLLRLDPALHEELRRWADQDLRSLNAHIEYLLRQALRRRRGKSDDEPDPHP